jgi:AraC family transcriptional regulator
VPHFHAHDPLLHHIALVLQATSTADSTAEGLYAEVLTNALAVHLLRRYAACRHTVPEMTGGLSPARLRRTIAYIQAHLEQELSLTTLAALVHLSPDHFARLFKQATGQTPHQYVLGCRIARAKQLLAETDVPLSAIGLQVGCTDQSYFTALFRKHVTMTPKAYRDITAGV